MHRLLSRRDKHTHEKGKKEVMPRPAFPHSPTPASVTCSSAMPRRSFQRFHSKLRDDSSSSPNSCIPLAFSTLTAKISPRLQATYGIIECSSADSGTFVLQPLPHVTPLDGTSFDEEGDNSDTEEDQKVRAHLRVLRLQTVDTR